MYALGTPKTPLMFGISVSVKKSKGVARKEKKKRRRDTRKKIKKFGQMNNSISG